MPPRNNGTTKIHKSQSEPLRVVELFAGVGGFRLGLEGYSGNRKPHHKHFKTVWFNQWEPSTRRQHAHETYVAQFGNIDEYTNKDIAQAIDHVPDHDLLVGGFPCQDYSVARNLSSAAGLEGKKGVLWWSIHKILATKGRNAPKYLMLENVDRLIKSPVSRRGRDFAVMLSTLNSLGYIVEWRVINAADYGMPQRRRRIFILAYKQGSPVYESFMGNLDPHRWLTENGIVQREFAAIPEGPLKAFEIDDDPVKVSSNFNESSPSKSPFFNSGVSVDHVVHTLALAPNYSGKASTLGDILIDESEVPEEFYIKDKEHIKRWKYLKGAKNEARKGSNGFEFTYTEGPMSFPDPLDKPSRTIITAEGGPTPSRFKHVIETERGLRRLTPVELERLCMFPSGHTAGHADSRRAFFMGNALVVGIVDKLGKALITAHKGEGIQASRKGLSGRAQVAL